MLTELPIELTDHIASNLSRDDLRSLRLTNSTFGNSTSRILFKTVVISKTKRDLARLLAIANSPRLFAIPTRLVWYELTEDQNDNLYDLAHREHISQYERRTYSMLYNVASSAFWTEPFFSNDEAATFKDASNPVPRSSATYPARRLATQASTEKAIGAAVRKLISLRTLVAQEMPSDWLLAVSDDGYRLEAGVMQELTHHTSPDPNGLFLLSRACLGETLTRQIGSLYLAGPLARPDAFAKYYSASPDALALFENLTTVDLCIPWVEAHVDGSDLNIEKQIAASFVKCLRSASKLQHFTLCFETHSAFTDGLLVQQILSGGDEDVADLAPEKDDQAMDMDDGMVEDEGTGSDGQRRRSTRASHAHHSGPSMWPLLESFQITDAFFSQSVLSRFIQRHSATLKHLSIFDCRAINKNLVSYMAAMPQLKLSSLRVRLGHVEESLDQEGTDDYFVPEQALLAFINNETYANPLEGTTREVFNTGPFVWDPEDWPSAAYSDLINCTVLQRSQPKGEMAILALPGETGIDLGYQDYIHTSLDRVHEAELDEEEEEETAPRNDETNQDADSATIEFKVGPEGIVDVDMTYGERYTGYEFPNPYDAIDTERIASWAEQTARDAELNLDEVAVESFGPVDRRWRQSYRQAMLLAEREADKRHAERCCGLNEEANPRWCWMRVTSRILTTDTLEQEIFYWKTTTPGRGHPTTNWTFYQEYDDGTKAHGFGDEPLDFFEDWDSQDGDDGDDGASTSDPGEQTLPEVGWRDPFPDEHPKTTRMYAVPSVWSRAFEKFLRDPFDMGDQLEPGVDVIKLQIVEPAPPAPESDKKTASPTLYDAMPDSATTVERGSIVRDMWVMGVTASVLSAEVGIQNGKSDE